MLRWSLLLLAACAGGETPGPEGCDRGALALDARVDAEGPSLADAAEAHVGIPPQGGAPYTAFGIVVDGALGGDTLLAITGEIRDDSGGVLGTIEQNTSVICANAGPWAGRWYGGEAHVRYWGVPLADLDGERVHAMVAIGRAGATLASIEGDLTLVSVGAGDTALVGEALP